MNQKSLWSVVLTTTLVAAVVGGGCAKKQQVATGGVTAPAPTPVVSAAPTPRPEPSRPEAPPPSTGAREEARPEPRRAPEPPRPEPMLGLDRIHFDFDKYAIKPEARDVLKNNAAFLTRNPGAQITIEGHCDERGTTEYNLALGERRARAAFQYLVDLGIDPNRMKTVSYGEEVPLDRRHNEDAWAKNRRAEFVEMKR